MYCLINNSYLKKNDLEISYSLIDELDNFIINKTFKVQIQQGIEFIKFSKYQYKNNNIENHINEISEDFNRSKYIFGSGDLTNIFNKLNSKDIFDDKVFNINQIIGVLKGLKRMF